MHARRYPLRRFQSFWLTTTKSTRKILKKIGYDADLATSGQEAIDRCAAINYDVVLMDIEMPGMDEYLSKPIQEDALVESLNAAAMFRQNRLAETLDCERSTG